MPEGMTLNKQQIPTLPEETKRIVWEEKYWYFENGHWYDIATNEPMRPIAKSEWDDIDHLLPF